MSDSKKAPMNLCVCPKVPFVDNQEKRFRVTPQQRFEAARVSTEPQRIELPELCVCLADGGLSNTVEMPFWVQIKELVYPGQAGDEEEIRDKWIYVFQGSEPWARVHALDPENWQCQYLSGAQPYKVPLPGMLELDPGPPGEPRRYHFFLSPVELTQPALDFLNQDQSRLLEAAVEPASDWSSNVVLVPDPFRWAADANHDFYMSRVQTYLGWMANANRNAELFIATTLRAWIGESDPWSIKGQLVAGKLEDHLVTYKKDRAALLAGIEEAGAYVAYCVDSPEYRTIEMACLERGGEDLSLCAHAYACALDGLLCSLPMQALGVRLEADPDRFPEQFVFGKNSDLAEQTFKLGRHITKATLKVAQELLSFRIDSLVKQGLEKPSFQWFDRRELLDVELLEVEPADPAESRRLASYRDKLKSASPLIIAPLELVNFFFEARKALQKDTIAPATASAGIKLVASLAEVAALLTSAPKLGDLVEGVSPSLAMVAGAIDFFTYSDQAAAALRREDYGTFVANEAMGTGTGLSVIATAVSTLAKFAPASAAGGLPTMLVFIVGAVLVAGGALLKAICEWCRRNQLQEFALRSFLGKGHGGDPKDYASKSVLPRPLPTPDRGEEARALLEVLSGFYVELDSSALHASDWALRIHPGLYLPESYFEVHLERKFTETMRSITSLRIYPESGKFEPLSTTKLNHARHLVVRDIPWFTTSSERPRTPGGPASPFESKRTPPVSRIDLSLESVNGSTYADNLGSWRAFIRFHLIDSICIPSNEFFSWALRFDIVRGREPCSVWHRASWTELPMRAP